MGQKLESIFNGEYPFSKNAVYLDLFSGTGSYLFEAVSRGVKLAYGVELESRLVESINKQAAKYEIDNKLICLCDDVLKIIPKFQKQSKLFDIVMIAPPQYKSIIDQTLKVMSEHKIIKDESLILCQHDSSEKNIDFQNFKIAQQRKYGNTTFTVLNSYEK